MFKPLDPRQTGDVISRLWVFAMFTMIFRDLHEMSTASTIEGILAGTFEGNPVTDAGLFFGGIAIVLLLLTGLFSQLLVPVAARRLNLVVVPLALAGMVMFFPNDPDDYLLGAVTAVALITIFVLAWRWQTQAAAPSLRGASHVA